MTPPSRHAGRLNTVLLAARIWRKRMNRTLLFYGAALAAFAAFLYFIVQAGAGFEGPAVVPLEAETHGPLAMFAENLLHVPGMLLLQIIVIVAAARLCGFFAVKIGQPAVIGEVVAGILLGPSLLGWLLPDLSALLFAPASLPGLSLLSQVGLILFMFVIGMELDPKLLRHRADSAVVISHVSIIVPFALGMTIALLLYAPFAPEHIPFLSFALFMGIAMSITAFPVLARILHDRGMSATPAGALSLACAAADDVTAWSVLAIVIAIVRAGDAVLGLSTLVAAGLYVAIMLGFVRPFLRRVGEVYADRERLTGTVVTGILLFLFISSLFTQIAGIHALFGAFLAGTLMPEKGPFRRHMTEKVHDLSVYILLPVFFAFTGLRTQIGLLNSSSHWLFTLLIIAVAVAGKFGGSAIAGRFLGESWRNSLIIGTLMNTRGLMELVVLNIGLELGVISPVIFTMMVIMALATTFMAGPGIALIERFFPERSQAEAGVLVAYAREETAGSLLQIGSLFAGDRPIVALHITPDTQRSSHDIDAFQEAQAEAFNQKDQGNNLRLITRAANDITAVILEETKRHAVDLLLVGGSKALFSSDPLSGRNRNLIEESPCSVGVFIDGALQQPEKIVLVGARKWPLLQSISKLPSFSVVAADRLPAPAGCLLLMDELTYRSRSFDGYSVLVLYQK
ncbi:MAG: potassium transporter Kef [Leptonema illini]|uniref:Potassium transporter Kef n=1 Tax=Leptonema illini TaxID=183 RepID=A0A833H2Q5_9LEPT|nr:MAG: potassium transporter Kef [Leptonema illini]